MELLKRKWTLQSTPAFKLEEDQYDSETYFGRVLNFANSTDCRTLLKSDAEVADAKRLLRDFERGVVAEGVSNEELWEAKKLVKSALHPTSGEPIPRVMRMASFVPMNVPIVGGMLLSSSVGGQLLFQWINQTYSAGLNYGNRSGTNVDTQSMMINYGLAVSSAMGVTAGLKKAAALAPLSLQRIATHPTTIPYIAVASAGAANIYFTRRSEIESGIPVSLEDGTEVGTSQVAAQQAVLQTVLSRGVLRPLPVLALPPLITAGMRRLPFLHNPRLAVPLELFAVTISLAGALPLSIAAFPQRLELSAASLEPRFHHLEDRSGKPARKLYSNKGL